MQALKDRLAEQQGRHQGGSKWIGTGGTSPFGHGGYNPEGVRIGGPGRHGRAIKVWEKREFRDLDGDAGARHAQHQGRAAPPAPLRPRGSGRGARPRRDDRRHGTARLARRQACGPSGTMRSSCCCSSTSAGRWTGMCSCARSCSRPAAPSSSISSISTSTTASTRACGRTIAAAMSRRRRPMTSSTSSAATISW